MKKKKILIISLICIIGLFSYVMISLNSKPKITPLGVTVSIKDMDKGGELFKEHFPGHVFWITVEWNKVHFTSMGKIKEAEHETEQDN